MKRNQGLRVPLPTGHAGAGMYSKPAKRSREPWKNKPLSKQYLVSIN
jgi:hypothetical protein